MRTTDTRGGALARVTLTRDDIGKAIVARATYRMVFVLPPDARHRDFRIIPAEADAPAAMQQKKDAFNRNAMRIFNRHNRSVPLDTLPISSYIR